MEEGMVKGRTTILLVFALIASTGRMSFAQDTIPFVPSPMHVVHKMLEVAEIKSGDILYDMGSGDGRVVIEAAKKYGIRGVGVDLNPELVAKARENPENRFEIKTWDTEFRRAPKRTLMARVYQPQGDGPFPELLDLHGGAWNNQDRTANAAMDEALAKSGILVVAIDLTRAPEAPYPSSVQDANYGVRWLNHRARERHGAPATIAALGRWTGAHE